MRLEKTDSKIIKLTKRWFIPTARVALFIIFFWFGILKFFDLSPASPLARAMVEKTIGLQYFDIAYRLLALVECVIGILFLMPKATRLVIPLLLFHLFVVSGPLVLLPELTWQKFLVPTLEGQYIIKNVAVIALAIGIAAHTTPIASAIQKRKL